jgi:CheY-like chemotaxis protein
MDWSDVGSRGRRFGAFLRTAFAADAIRRKDRFGPGDDLVTRDEVSRLTRNLNALLVDRQAHIEELQKALAVATAARDEAEAVSRPRSGLHANTGHAICPPSVDAASEPADTPLAEVELSQLRVLAAEDNETNQMVLTAILGAVGVTPFIVPDGRQAVEAWSREDFDLILMDIQMPNLDGVAATLEIRAQETVRGRGRTRIVALTANAMSHQVAEYEAAGMDGLVTKPISVEKLYAVLAEAVTQPTDTARAA